MSRDAVAVATLFAAVFVLRVYFRSAAETLSEFMAYCLSLVKGTTEAVSPALFVQFIAASARVSLPLMLAVVFLAIAATFGQTGMLVAFALIKPKIEHVNPIEGVKRLFSLRSLVEVAKNLLKIILLLWIVYGCLRDMMDISPRYMYADLGMSSARLMGEIFSMLLRVSLTFLVLAALDFLYQWWDYERQMRMTKQEVKDEYKQLEGDPKVKGRIRELQRRMSQSRMMQKVPQADVIIRNPTHVAVALRYRYREDEAPIVLAMGQDALAARILAVAEQYDITVVENPPLARALYAEAALNQPIPSDLFEAVAEVMVYLYRLGRVKAESTPEEAGVE